MNSLRIDLNNELNHLLSEQPLKFREIQLYPRLQTNF